MPEAPSRVERLLNLLACLLDTSVPLTQEEIAREVAGYPESKSARRRAFERDKETLRSMGVPIALVSLPYGDGNEVGYRVDPQDYYLPALDLTPEEQAAINVAVNAVSVGDRAGEAALMKLGGLTEAAVPPIAMLPLAPGLPAIFDAWRRRATVTFTYRSETRTVEVWSISSRRGRWYVVGRDLDRDAIRTFRADRIDAPVDVGPGEEFDVPPTFDPADYQRDEPWLWAAGEVTIVDLLADDDVVDEVRGALGDVPATPGPDGSGTILRVPVTHWPGLRDLVLGYREHVEVLGPPEVRAELVAWLEAVAAA